MSSRRTHYLKLKRLFGCACWLALACWSAHWVLYSCPNSGVRLFYTLFASPPAEGRYGFLPAGQSIFPERVCHVQKEKAKPTESPVVHLVSLSASQVENCFASSPISPLDLAVLLRCVKDAGAGAVGISLPFSWEKKTEPLALSTLGEQIADLPYAVLGLRARMVSRPEFLPMELENEAIPGSRIIGDVSLFPAANAVMPGKTSFSGGGKEIWAIDRIEDDALMNETAEDGCSVPLFIRWHGGVYPTMPMKLAWLILGVRAEEVTLKPGESLSWRGVKLPLDSRGRTLLCGGERCEFVATAELVDGKNQWNGEAVLLCEPQRTESHPEAAMLKMGRTLSRLLTPTQTLVPQSEKTPEKLVWLRRGEDVDGILLYVLCALGFLYLFFIPSIRPLHHILLDVALVVIGCFWLGSTASAGIWMPIAPWCAFFGILAIASRVLRFFRPVIRRAH